MENKQQNEEVALVKLTKDLRAVVSTMTATEARYLVDSFYQMQENRLRAAGQIRSVKDEPHEVLGWMEDNATFLENQIGAALVAYSQASPVGRWAESVCGIGPIISAGLLAHIDITKAPTVGHIWRLMGYDPTQRWWGKEGARELVNGFGDLGIDELIVKCGEAANIRPERLREMAQRLTKTKRITTKNLMDALAKRPWNASLKLIGFKIGESFVKVKKNPNAYYGRVYSERKAYEWARNFRGECREAAAKALSGKRWGDATNAKAWYSGQVDPKWALETYQAIESGTLDQWPLTVKKGEGFPMLPPAQIHRRATRYAAKLFLSHWHEVAYELHYGKKPPLPYPIANLGHAHKIDPGEAGAVAVVAGPKPPLGPLKAAQAIPED